MPVKTMVIQRARLGDLLQTLPLIRTLEALGEDVTCLVSQDMVEAARLAFPEGRVAGFPGKGSLLEIASASPLKAAGKIHRLLKDFGNTSYDRILQLNHDGTGVLLGRLLPASERRGFLALQDRSVPGEGAERLSGWPAYLVASARGVRALNRIHLSDVWKGFGLSGAFRSISGPSPPLPARPGPVGVVLSGRSSYRELALEDAAILVDRVRTLTGRPVVLLGRPDERDKACVLTRLVAGPVVNRVGETSLARLWEEVATLSLLVSPDTATLHLAASLNVPSVGLFFANAQPHETGAYISGSLSVSPDMECHPCAGEGSGCVGMECRGMLNPDYLALLVAGLLAGSALPMPPPGLLVWRSGTQGGFLCLRPAHSRPASREDLLGLLFRRFYLRVLEPSVLLPSLEEECQPYAGRGWPSLLSEEHLVAGASLSSRPWADNPSAKRRILDEIPLLWPLFLFTEETERGAGDREIQRRAFENLSEETRESGNLLTNRHHYRFGGMKGSRLSVRPEPTSAIRTERG